MSPILLLLLEVVHVFAVVYPLDPKGKPTADSIETFYIDPLHLWSNRDLWKQGRKELNPSIRRMLRLANSAVADKTVYAVTRKPSNVLPPSNDPRDFYSLARYYWPNPAGGQYIRKDGLTNPEIYSLPDSTYLQVVINDVFTLGLAYFFTGNETFAATATSRLNAWFLDPATRMNPNLNYANWVKGQTLQNSTASLTAGGLLDMSKIYLLIDGLQLIKKSKSLSAAQYDGVRNWLLTYGKWLTTSARGSAESTAVNNIGTWYDVQLTTLQLFAGNVSDAAVTQKNVLNRMAIQVMPDGSQPLEQARPLSWHYSNFNLLAYFVHGALADNTGVEVFKFRTSDGRSIAGALTYLVSFAKTNGSNWPVPNSGDFDPSVLIQNLKDAYVEYRDIRYQQQFNDLQKNKPQTWNIRRLWAPYGSYDNPITSAAAPSISSVSMLVVIGSLLLNFIL